MSRPPPASRPRRKRRPRFVNTLVGVTLLGVTLITTIWFRVRANDLARHKAPTALASQQAYGAVQRSLAALRGWVSVGASSFRSEREQAWEQGIRPAMAELATLRESWSSEEDQRAFAELGPLLDELAVSQWWVEEVAQTPGNDPARALFHESIYPMATTISQSAATLIEHERARSDAADPDVMHQLVAFERAFRQTLERLLVSSDGATVVQPFQLTRQSTLDALVRIDALGDKLTAEQLRIVAMLMTELRGFTLLTDEYDALQRKHAQGVSRRLIRDETIPLAERVTALLAGLSSRQGAAMRRDAASVLGVSGTVIWITVMLIALMAVVGVFGALSEAKDDAEATGELDGSSALASERPPSSSSGADTAGGGVFDRLSAVEAANPGAVRVAALWIVLPLWVTSILLLVRIPNASELAVALLLSFVVGSFLNTLNWSSPGRGFAHRLVWGLRFAGNYAVPFAVSTSSSLVASIG